MLGGIGRFLPSSVLPASQVKVACNDEYFIGMLGWNVGWGVACLVPAMGCLLFPGGVVCTSVKLKL